MWLGVAVVGVLMAAMAFTPPLDPPQCPDHATRMPDGSHCIIGANIGAGLVWLEGMFGAFVGAVGLAVSVGAQLWDRRTSVPPAG
jgi:hypothetical protein